jgi:TonB-dependent starch-binding outer membrane protein SusC
MKKQLLGKFSFFLLFFLSFSLGLSAQNFSVSGKITDDGGKPLEGATVQEKGTKNSVVTGQSGAFQMTVKSAKAVLVISFVGHEAQTVPVNNQSQLSVTLKSANENLNDVVVVGYATVKKKDVTGSVQGIGATEIQSRPVANALEAMQGKIAGVDITTNERPGQVGGISIHGARSLGSINGNSVGAGNSPLYVVDGIPLSTGGIENINPQDIEAIDVLKDASATAVYGSRGANGVIIVTTKQGKSGKLTLGFNNSIRLDNLVDSREMFNAGEYITFKRWAQYYSGLNTTTGVSAYPRGDQPTLANDRTLFAATADPSAWNNIAKGWASGTWDGNQVTTTDWRSMVTQQGITSDNTISVSGGTDKIKAYGSFGYSNNKGVIKGQSFRRFTARTSVDMTPTKWLSFGNNMSVSYGTQEFGQSSAGVSTIGNPAGGLYESARSIYPYAVPYDSAGNKIPYPGGDAAVKNIIDEEKYNQDQRVTLRAFGSIYGQVNLGNIIPVLKGLKFRLNFGPDISFYRDGIYVDASSVANGGSTNYASLQNTKTFSYTLDNLVYYDRTFGNHSVGVTLLHSATAYTQESSSLAGNGVPYSPQLWNALKTGTIAATSLTVGSDISKYQLLSLMARINYSYKDKYLLTASVRRDGSSVLPAGNKQETYPSVALAWRINKEGFMSGLHWLNDLKLRVGVGVVGNSNIPAYTSAGPVTSLFYPYFTANSPGALINTLLPNLGLKWEKTVQNNIGFDYSLFNRRVSGSFDVYSSTTELILRQSLPTATGYLSTFANIGKTANNGFDINLTTVNIKRKDLMWTTTVNAAWQKEHIVSLATGSSDINNNWFVGQSIGVIYGYKTLGLWQAADSVAYKAFNANGSKFFPGNVRVADLNGDNKIDPNNDREILGWTRPRWVLGMTNTVSFKGWEVSMFIYGRLNYLYNWGGEVEAARSVNRKINYYNENNLNGEFQKPIFNSGGAAGDSYYTALGYSKASFLKIRNISVGHVFNSKMLSRTGISNLKLYAQVANPGMLTTKLKFVEMDVNGPTWNRGFTFGLNASF